MKEENDIDKLFREGLKAHDIPFNELDWDNLEKQLHPEKQKRAVPIAWLSVAAGIAIVLALLLFWNRENISPDNRIVRQAKNNGLKNRNTIPSISVEKEKDQKQRITDPIIQNSIASTITDHHKNQLPIIHKRVNALKNINTLDVKYQKHILPVLVSLSSPKPITLATTDTITLIKPEQRLTSISPKSSFKPALDGLKKSRLTLSLVAAPDLTGVEQSGRSNLNGSLGINLTYTVTKKLSFTTGAILGKKIYDADYALYKPNAIWKFAVQPDDVHANCTVLDIPVNANYIFFQNRKNAVSVTAGLSSYLMLNEKYSYLYDNGRRAMRTLNISNQNQHYLGIANIGMQLHHKINNRFSISAGPFIKLPLTEIGDGNMKLTSIGVNTSIDLNLFKKK